MRIFLLLIPLFFIFVVCVHDELKLAINGITKKRAYEQLFGIKCNKGRPYLKKKLSCIKLSSLFTLTLWSMFRLFRLRDSTNT